MLIKMDYFMGIKIDSFIRGSFLEYQRVKIQVFMPVKEFNLLLIFYYQLLFGSVMLRGTKRKNLSFYDYELSNSFQRYKKMAQIQSKLIFSDLSNNQLITQIGQLKAQNLQLRQKMLQKELKETAISIKYPKKPSTPKMFDQAPASQNTTLKNLKSLYTQNHHSTYPDLSSIQTQLVNRQKKCECDCQKQSSIILDKNVYMERALRERPLSLNNSCDRQVQTKTKEKQFRRSLSNAKKQPNLLNQSKFPGQLNEFQGRQAQSRFMQCNQIPKERDEDEYGEMNRWKSQGKVSFKNQSNKSGQIKKRKFFLSLVSVSSCEGKKSKIN